MPFQLSTNILTVVFLSDRFFMATIRYQSENCRNRSFVLRLFFPALPWHLPSVHGTGLFLFPGSGFVSLPLFGDLMKVYLMDLTAKQEKFCQGVAKGLTYSDAYRQAYNAEKMKPETINKRAYELLKNGYVTGRIDELKEMALSRHNIKVDDIIEELEDARNIARELGQSSAMVSASMGKAKLLGLVVDKKALTDSVGNDITTPLVKSSELLDIMERRFERNRSPQSPD